MAAKQQIEPSWLEDGKDVAACPVCMFVLEEPTSGCPEGHAFCRACYLKELSRRKRCPSCRHDTDEKTLQRCRPLETLIGKLRLRCKHGPDEAGDGGGGGSGAPPLAKRAKLSPAESMSADDLRKELGPETEGKKGELVARADAVAEGPQRCAWRGRVCELAGHLSESCALEPVKCPNAEAGCKELMLRSVAARHASEICAYRKAPCRHCQGIFMVRDLPQHHKRCPKAHVKCKNKGCDVKGARGSMPVHYRECGWQVVTCPCPGCDKEMTRAEVEEHVETSGALHLRSAWGAAEELEGKVEEQAVEIEELQGLVTGLQRRAEALSHVFTWNTDSAWRGRATPPFTFTDGVRGICVNSETDNDGNEDEEFMGFRLVEGPPCTAHFKCSILDKDGKVLRVVCDDDFGDPPTEVEIGSAWGSAFTLTAADKAGAVRADGSIQLRMVVYLYLAE